MHLVASTIDFPTVSHPIDAHLAGAIGNFVNHAVVTHTNAPVMFAAGQFAAAGRARVVCERLNGRDDAVVNLGSEPREVFLGGAFKQDAIHGHLRLRSAR